MMTSLLEQSGYTFNEQKGIWARPSYGGIAYNDGDEVENRLAAIVSEAQDLSVLSLELRNYCTDWPSLYHLGASRANVLRPFETALKNADVLEVGAGCGAITRYLGETGANVLALEGAVRRASIARSRTRDLDNVTVVCERFDQLATEHRFDVVTLIGVLEYAHQFMPGDRPDVGMLRHARSLLKPGGVLILAIENQLGLKYFAGAPEDHVGIAMYGIESRYRDDQPHTYGRRTLATILSTSGFGHLQFMVPCPDYKLPVSIVTEAGVCDPDFDASALACQSVRRDPQLASLLSFSPELTWPVVFQNNLGIELANSFLVVASVQTGLPCDSSILAYHYNTGRRPEYCKETVFVRKSDGTKSQCRLLSPSTEVFPGAVSIKYRLQAESDYMAGKSLASDFIETITRDDWRFEELEAYFRRYLAILSQLMSPDGQQLISTTPNLCDVVPGRYIDAIPQNILREPSGRYCLIDTEWQCTNDIPLSRLLFRAIMSSLMGVSRYGRPMASEQPITRGGIITEIFRRIGGGLLCFEISSYLAEECAFQELVTGRSDQELVQTWPNLMLVTDNLSSALRSRNAQLSHQVEQISKFDEQLGQLGKQLAHEVNQGIERESKIQQMAKTLQTMEKSISWRSTRPLRTNYARLQHIARISSGANLYRKQHGVLRMLSHALRMIAHQGECVLHHWFQRLSVRIVQAFPVSTIPSKSALEAIDRIVSYRNAFTMGMSMQTRTGVQDDIELPPLDISVVTYNSSKWIDTFVASLLDVCYDKKLLSITFVDNSSTDDTVEKIRKNIKVLEDTGFRVSLLQRPNRGYGAGHNAALQRGDSPFCLVTNVDLTFDTLAIQKIVTEAVCGSTTIAAWEFRQKPYEHPKYYCPVTGLTNWNSHACVLLRRSALDDVGGYDEALFMYGEDVELSYRLRRGGYRLRYCPESVVWHYAYESPNQIKTIQYRGSLLANLYIRAKYGSRADMMQIVPMSVSSLLGPEAYSGARRDVLKCLLKMMRLLPRALITRKKSDEAFPFVGWDYGYAREGAFYESMALPETTPLVSVITRTTAGRSEYLKQAMLSVANQTWGNIEYLVVEDGGASMESLVNNVCKATGISVIYLAADKVGRSAVANIGLAKATGRWCLFLDDDDLLFADHIEVLAGALMNNEGSVAAYSLAWAVKTSVSESGPWRYTEACFDINPIHYQQFDYSKLCVHNYIPIQSVLFDRVLYEERGGMDEDMHALEDWVLWAKYAAQNQFIYVPKVTSMYRVPLVKEVEASRQTALDAAYDKALEVVNKNTEQYARLK